MRIPRWTRALFAAGILGLTSWLILGQIELGSLITRRGRQSWVTWTDHPWFFAGLLALQGGVAMSVAIGLLRGK